MAILEPVGFTDDETWFSGDSRELQFRVTEDGDVRDITDDDVKWYLLERPYLSFDDALLDSEDSGVSVGNSSSDPDEGEFLVQVDADVTTGLWGKYWQVAVVEGGENTRVSWRGEVYLESMDEDAEDS